MIWSHNSTPTDEQVIKLKQAIYSKCVLSGGFAESDFYGQKASKSLMSDKNTKIILTRGPFDYSCLFVLLTCRLGRHGKVFLTIPSQGSTDEQKFIQKGEAPGTDSLFDLDPKDTVFFVGGVPLDVKVTSFTHIPSNSNQSLFNYLSFLIWWHICFICLFLWTSFHLLWVSLPLWAASSWVHWTTTSSVYTISKWLKKWMWLRQHRAPGTHLHGQINLLQTPSPPPTTSCVPPSNSIWVQCTQHWH